MIQSLKNKKTFVSAIIFAIVIITVAFYSVLASLIIASFVLSSLVIKALTTHLNFSTTLRLIISIPFYAFILQFSTLCIWLINKSAPLDSATFLAFVVLATTLALVLIKRPRDAGVKTKKTSTHDIISILAGIFFVLVIIMPVSIRFHGLPEISAIGFIDGNVDDAAHLGAVTDRIQHNRGVFLKSDHTTDLRSLAISGGSYPPGWHATNAVVARAIIPGIQVGEQTLWFYVLSKIFWFFILVVLFFRFGLYALSTLQNKSRRFSLAIYTLGLTLFTFYFLIDAFRLGSYTFMPQLISVLLTGLVLLTYKQAKSPSERASLLVLAGVVSLGGGLSWILTLPVIGVVLILLALEQIRQPIEALKQFGVQTLRYAPIYLLAASATLTQVIIMRSTQSGGGIIDHINEYGYIARYNEMFFIAIILGVILFAFANRKKDVDQKRKYVLIFTAALLLLSAFIYMLQLITNEEINYYFYKTLNVFYVLAIPIAVASMAYAWSVLQEKHNLNKIWAGVFAFTSLFLIIGFPAGDSPTISYLSGKLGLNQNVSKYTYDYISNAEENANKYTFYFNPSNPTNSDLSTMLMKSVPLDSNCYVTLRPSFTDSTTPYEIAGIIGRVCQDKKLTIITDTLSIEKFSAAFESRNIMNVSLREIK